jgi:hypothetical protein
MRSIEIEDALDELYAAAPEDFVAERARLAKELKAEGRGVEAAQLSKTKKPSLAAWALNRLVRERRRDVDLLLDSGHRLRAAQAGVLQGAERDAFTQARRTEREAVDRLTREAENLLRERGSASDAVLAQVSASLRAAAVSEEGRELLARGRFTQALTGGQGFELLGELAGEAPPQPPARQRTAAAKKKTEERQRAREALNDAKATLRQAERNARGARQEAERIAAAARSAEHDADAAEKAAEAAARAVAKAQDRLDRL